MGFWSSPMRPVIRTHKPTNSWRTVEAHGGDQDTDRFARTHTTVVALTRALANFRPCRKTPSPGAECGDCHRRAYLIIGKSYIMHPVTNSTRFRVWGHVHHARRLGQACRLGALLNDLYYAGTRDGPGGEHVSNITPDCGSRIGRWSETELAYFLNTGANPQGDYAGSLMVEVIDDRLRYLNDADLDAIATYVLALPPVSNPLAHDKRNKRKSDEFGY